MQEGQNLKEYRQAFFKWVLFVLVIACTFVGGYFLLAWLEGLLDVEHTYVLGWVYFNKFAFMWVLPMVLTIFLKYKTAIAVTITCFAGIPVAELLGDIIHNYNVEKYYRLLEEGIESPDLLYHESGVFIWFGLIILTAVLGLIIEHIYS